MVFLFEFTVFGFVVSPEVVVFLTEDFVVFFVVFFFVAVFLFCDS